MIRAKSFSLPFVKKERVARQTFSFYFDRRGVDFDFFAGQYIRMSLPHEAADERGTTRFFTIASSPHEKEYLMITTKIIASSFKKTLCALQPGQDVDFFGPMGRVYFDEQDRTERVFLAGGIGITPFHSMITYAAWKTVQIPLTLFVAFPKSEEIIFYDKLSQIARKNRNIRIIYTLSQGDGNASWQGETGRISETMLRNYISNISSPKYYITGAPAMVGAMKMLLASMQIDEEKIVTEDFSGY